MIHCISCEKFPKDLRQVPYNFVGSADTFKVKLLSDTTPVTFPVDGSGVAELSDDVKFAFGSILYILDQGKTYIFGQSGFQEWTGSNIFEIDNDGTVHG